MSKDGSAPAKPKRRRWRWIAGFVVFAGLFGWFGIPYIYINFINKPEPALSFEQRDKELAEAAATAVASDSVATPDTAPGVTVAEASASEGVDGTWNVVSPSTAGYRVKEVLNGQDTEAVGRTTDVEGTVTIAGTSVTAVELSVDLTTVSSDESRRDDAFRGRIMNTEEFPVALFSLTEAIVLDAVPAVGETATATAKGTLTMHGVENAVEFPLTARRSASTIEVLGTIPITFADYEIDNPSIGFVTTEDVGVIEFLITLAPA